MNTKILALLLLVPFLLSACKPASPVATPQPTPAPVMLQFIGNSCTLITAPDGTRIVSDPYAEFSHPDGIGPLPSDLKADAVTVSHSHPDHNNAEAVGGAPQVFTGPGTLKVGMAD